MQVNKVQTETLIGLNIDDVTRGQCFVKDNKIFVRVSFDGEPIETAAPVGGATEAKQDTSITALNNLLTELAKKANADDTQTVSVSNFPTQTTPQLVLVDHTFIDSSVSPIPASNAAATTIVNSLPIASTKIKVIDGISDFIGLYDGLDDLICILPMGYTGGDLDIFIPAGTEIKIRSLGGELSDGKIAIQFLG